MAYVLQTLYRRPRRRLNRRTIRNAVLRVLRANKDITAAVAALQKTMSRREAVTLVINRNPAVQTALMQELAKLWK